MLLPCLLRDCLVAQWLNNLPAGAVGFDPWVGKVPWRGHGYSLQHSCLENPMDRGARWATVHGIAKSRTRLKQLSYTVSWGSTITTQHLEINPLHAAKAWDGGRLLRKGRVVLIWVETCSEPMLFSCPTVPRVAPCVKPDVVPGHHADLKPRLCLKLALECVGLTFIVPEPWGEEKAKAKQIHKPRIFYSVCVLVALLCPTLWDPMDCSLPGPLSIEFSRQEYWSRLPVPSLGDLPDPGIKHRSPALQADVLLSELYYSDPI